MQTEDQDLEVEKEDQEVTVMQTEDQDQEVEKEDQ